METEKILLEAKKHLEDHKLENYEELKSAIESKKINKEIEGIKFNRFVASISTLAAVISVFVLIIQSSASVSYNNKQALDLRIENLKEKIQGYEQAEEEGEKNLKLKEIEVKKLDDAITDRNKSLNKVQSSIATLNEDRERLNNGIKKLKNEVYTISKEMKDIELSKARTTGLVLRNKNIKLERELNELKKQLGDKQNELKMATNSLMEQSQLNSSLKNDKIILDHLKNRTGFKEVKIKSLKKGEKFKIGNFEVTFTNVGNRVKNVDLNIKERGAEARNFINMNQGERHVLTYRNGLFLLNVLKANQFKNRSKESCEIELTLFEKKYSLIY